MPTGAGEFERGWLRDDRHATLVEFVRPGESVESWSELFTIQFFEDVYVSPERAMYLLMAGIREQCPDATWTVINEERNSVMYEWTASACDLYPAQHEIVRLLRGNDGVHRIAFVKKTDLMPEELRNKWIDVFLKAYVEKNGRRVIVQPRL
ncbi:hypothetical protein [Halotalea alkalilenta]|uniref:hypothetical protein n=1 Tax=Halotalea alkalilenta TaxID=376489 RepID=UPI0012DCCA53|nr:hypothetical protein [Halotalea alkalilenta]